MMNEIPGAAPDAKGNAHSDALDELPVAYVEMDAHGAITRANRLTRSLHSSHSGELIGKPAWELMPAEDREMSRMAFTTAMETGEDPPVARRSIFTASGAYRVHELHRNVIRSAQGQPAGMRVVTVDVTEAHKAYEEARRDRLWLESVVASLADAVIVTDALGFIRSANPAAEKLFGWKAGEMTGKLIEEALPVRSQGTGGETMFSFALALSGHCRGAAILLDRERREVQVEIDASPIVDKDNGFTSGVVSVLRRVESAG
jgi:two-component system sensor kinase FixL